MRVFSYVVARDYGFAPNPFHGVCTLATCKQQIRRVAQVRDWIVGTGPAAKGDRDRLVYAMRVGEVLSYNEYWSGPRFRVKRPNLQGSLKQAYGDNIYHRTSETDEWEQEDSHHSLPDGSVNTRNVEIDTIADRVLVSSEYVYWGGSGPLMPNELRNPDGIELRAGRGRRSRFSEEEIEAIVPWLESLPRGYLGKPSDW